MLKESRIGVSLFLVLTAITGVAYPLAVTATAYVFYPHKARGSLIHQERPIGSELIGQAFDAPEFFWGRPSATGPVPYNGLGGSGSNQAPTNPALIEAIQQRIAKLREADPSQGGAIPVDLVTASASGLDPHISPAAAYFQAFRVARARSIDPNSVDALIAQHIEQPSFGILGQPRINVLKLNIALEQK